MLVYHGSTLEIKSPIIIPNDNVGETVSYVMQGIMRKEDALERLKFEKINNQIAFCSDKALKEISFVRSYKL